MLMLHTDPGQGGLLQRADVEHRPQTAPPMSRSYYDRNRKGVSPPPSPATFAADKTTLLAEMAACEPGDDESFLWITAHDMASVSQLRADKEVVMTALSFNGMELKQVSLELMADPEVVLAAAADPHAADNCRAWPRHRAARSRMTVEEWDQYKDKNDLCDRGPGYHQVEGPLTYANPGYRHCVTILRVCAIENDADRQAACADPATLEAVTTE